MARVYLSPSTQESNITINGGNEEYYMNLIANAMIPYLQASGIEYGRNDPDMTASQSAQTANTGDYDFYLAIHSNAAGTDFSGRVRGAEVYYYPGSAEGERASNIFANNYKEIYPIPDFVRTIPSRTLIELNSTDMPAILFEVAYHDNQQDFAWLSANINEIAENLVVSLTDYFGIPFNEPEMFARGVVNISSGNLNIRNAPSANSRIIGTLSNGESVNIIESENGWLKIRNNGSTGYVDSKFVRVL